MLYLIFGVLVGVFAIFCSIKDYDWFMESRKARFIVRLLGREGARLFYIILGILIIILSLGAYASGQL
ncbi:MAG: immunity 17 family protein [Oscillospiraceae bacterium]|nr:immunity 17 family protein [Oscillospiraceae bacterium]